MRNLVFDIGGTAIKYGVCRGGVMEHQGEVPTEAAKGGRHILDKIISLAEAHTGYEAIGISTAGRVNSETGAIICANSNIPGYTGMEPGRELSERFGVPVTVENDVNCAAIGEAAYGAGKEYRDFLCLTYGTGVGGAIFLNGNLYHGAYYSAGEFGGIVTHGSARSSGCTGDALAGCYERYASTSALVRMAQKLDPALDSGRAVFASLENARIKGLVDCWIEEVLLGLVTILHIFNPPCVILGGGIMAQPYILEKIRSRLPAKVMPGFAEVRIVPAKLGNTAGMLGAYYLAEQR